MRSGNLTSGRLTIVFAGFPRDLLFMQRHVYVRSPPTLEHVQLRRPPSLWLEHVQLREGATELEKIPKTLPSQLQKDKHRPLTTQ